MLRVAPYHERVAQRLDTERLTLRQWRVDDAEEALAIYGHNEVARWLSPAMGHVPDATAMESLLQRWIDEDAKLPAPTGRWAIDRREDGKLLGGAVLLPLPPGDEDIEVGWQLRPDEWGNGYAGEATQALAAWAFSQDVDEIFAVVRPGNTRAAASVRRSGMEWVGETGKYYGLTLQVFRLRPGDSARTTRLPPNPPAG